MNKHIEKGYVARILALTVAFSAIGFVANLQAAPPPPDCTVSHTFTSNPAWTVGVDEAVTLTQEVRVATATAACTPLASGDLVNDGANQMIQEVTLGQDGPAFPCADLGNQYCTNEGNEGVECEVDADCDTEFESGDGVCTAVAAFQLEKNPPFGQLTYDPDTSVAGTYGFNAKYEGGANFTNAAQICTDLIVQEAECEGAIISIDQADGPGEPAPGTYNWSFIVTVHACEDLDQVSAQGGTNGWAQLVDRSASSLHPSKGDVVIRNANKKTDVILWTIGPMKAGDDETLEVDLRGTVKTSAPDCEERFLSGAWSALFSADGEVFEKSDYTGRVSIFTNTNSTPDDCE